MEQRRVSTEELFGIVSALNRTPPETCRSRCKTADQLAVFDALKIANLILSGWLEDYFSGVPYRKPEGVSKEDEKLLRAELDKLLALYDLLWWSWGDIVHYLERDDIYLKDFGIYGPADAIAMYARLFAAGVLQCWTGGYENCSKESHKQMKATFAKGVKAMANYDPTDRIQKREVEKAFEVIDKVHEREPQKALEWLLVTGVLKVIQDEGRKSPTKRRYKRYTEASKKFLALSQPYTSLGGSFDIIHGSLKLA